MGVPSWIPENTFLILDEKAEAGFRLENVSQPEKMLQLYNDFKWKEKPFGGVVKGINLPNKYLIHNFDCDIFCCPQQSDEEEPKETKFRLIPQPLAHSHYPGKIVGYVETGYPQTREIQAKDLIDEDLSMLKHKIITAYQFSSQPRKMVNCQASNCFQQVKEGLVANVNEYCSNHEYKCGRGNCLERISLPGYCASHKCLKPDCARPKVLESRAKLIGLKTANYCLRHLPNCHYKDDDWQCWNKVEKEGDYCSLHAQSWLVCSERCKEDYCWDHQKSCQTSSCSNRMNSQ